MYCRENNINHSVNGGIICFKKLNDGFLPFGVQIKPRQHDFEITPQVFDDFLMQLEHLIAEICNINLPFVKKDEPVYYS